VSRAQALGIDEGARALSDLAEALSARCDIPASGAGVKLRLFVVDQVPAKTQRSSGDGTQRVVAIQAEHKLGQYPDRRPIRPF
jgi:hypothetical protein